MDLLACCWVIHLHDTIILDVDVMVDIVPLTDTKDWMGSTGLTVLSALVVFLSASTPKPRPI
jgi:hypothetical protein